MGIYGSLASTTRKLVVEYGQPVVFVAPSDTFNLATGAGTIGTPTEHAAHAVVEPNKRGFVNPPTDAVIRQSLYGGRLVDGDIKLTVSASDIGVEPVPGWLVYLDSAATDATKRWRVVDVAIYSPGGTPLAYIVGCAQ